MFTRLPARRRRPECRGLRARPLPSAGCRHRFRPNRAGLLHDGLSRRGGDETRFTRWPSPKLLSRQVRGHPGSVAHGHGQQPEPLHGRQPACRIGLLVRLPGIPQAPRRHGPRSRFPPPDRGRVGVRLPRRTTSTYWFGGEDMPKDPHAWVHTTSENDPHPVGLLQPNPWGLYDIQGNVWEWCSDWWGHEYYSESPESDPQGLRPATRRYCGGSFSNPGSFGAQPTAATSIPTSDTITTAFA